MDVVNQMGYLQHWGISPAINLTQSLPPQSKLTFLISGSSDIRHVIKTLADITDKDCQVTVYFHQTSKQLICRSFLLWSVLLQSDLSEQQLVDLFLDLYGNALLRQRSLNYLSATSLELLHFVHDQLQKCKLPIGQFVHLKGIKYQERDQLAEILQSWRKQAQFQIQKHRNQRIRFLYGERYDYRFNMYDWDYNFHTRDNAPIIHYYHYKTWRESGVAFQARFSKYNYPNKTLSSYLPGKKKADRTSCLVRGFWGDIVVTPYIGLGIDCTYQPQKSLLFKKANEKFIGHSVQVSQYNLFYWIRKLRTGQAYRKRFLDYYRMNEQDKQAYKKKKQAQRALKQTIEEAEEQQNQEAAEGDQVRNQKQELQQSDKKIQEGGKAVPQGLKKFKFIPTCDKIENLIKKHKGAFDAVLIAFSHSKYLQNKEVLTLIKPEGHLIIEKPTFVPFSSKEDKKKIQQSLEEIIDQNFIRVGEVGLHWLVKPK